MTKDIDMSWFDKTRVKQGFLKMAGASNNTGDLKTELDWRGQAEDFLWFGDTQRYVFDSQTVKIFLSRTSEKWAVSLMTNHTYIGTCGFSIFWTFDLSEGKEAKRIYKLVDETAREIIKEFIEQEKPTSTFYPTLRRRLRDITDRDNMVRTNIPAINYSYDLPLEEDWRETIYGKRYPAYKEESFDQYLNSSIYHKDKEAPTGKFAL
jgi:hypothetical protein